MKILIVNLDSKIKNLALAKIEKYYKDRGADIYFDLPMYRNCVDAIYVSCVFSKNKGLCEEWESDISYIGGSGYNISKTLPAEIDAIKPRINFGYTTRGCNNNCGFCIVPQKEGKVRVEGDLLDLWDGTAKDIVLLDNNILQLPEHFVLICRQARDNNIKLDFNQGLDHRLLNNDILAHMKKTKHVEYRFSFDHPSYINTVEAAIDMLEHNNIKRCFWFVLVGFNTTPQEDLFRLDYLRKRNQNAYVQRFSNSKFATALARWANQQHLFRGMTFKQFINHKDNITNYKEFEKYCDNQNKGGLAK